MLIRNFGVLKIGVLILGAWVIGGCANVPEDSQRKRPAQGVAVVSPGKMDTNAKSGETAPSRMGNAASRFSITTELNGCAESNYSAQVDASQVLGGTVGSVFSAWLSKRIYDVSTSELLATMSQLGFVKAEVIERPGTSVRVLVASRPDFAVVVFRGSTDNTNWISNANFITQQGASKGLPGWVHSGFSVSFAEVWPTLVSKFSEHSFRESFPVLVTGHSLGGALAAMTAYRIQNEKLGTVTLHTFGQPRAGDVEFATALENLLAGRYLRFVHGNDAVPRVPPSPLAASAFSALLPSANFVSTLAFQQMRYAHSGVLVPLETQAPQEMAKVSDAQDAQYWQFMSGLSGGVKFPDVLKMPSLRMSIDHMPLAYLCKVVMRSQQ